MKKKGFLCVYERFGVGVKKKRGEGRDFWELLCHRQKVKKTKKKKEKMRNSFFLTHFLCIFYVFFVWVGRGEKKAAKDYVCNVELLLDEMSVSTVKRTFSKPPLFLTFLDLTWPQEFD